MAESESFPSPGAREAFAHLMLVQYHNLCTIIEELEVAERFWTDDGECASLAAGIVAWATVENPERTAERLVLIMEKAEAAIEAQHEEDLEADYCRNEDFVAVAMQRSRLIPAIIDLAKEAEKLAARAAQVARILNPQFVQALERQALGGHTIAEINERLFSVDGSDPVNTAALLKANGVESLLDEIPDESGLTEDDIERVLALSVDEFCYIGFCEVRRTR